MKIYKAKDYKDMSRKAANIISAQVIMKPNCVLGLATGSTPIGTYDQLVEWYNKGDLDFSEVTTVNLDEYKGLPRTNDQSYYYFMHQHLFDRVNIDPERTNVPNGMEPDAEKECGRYEELIRSLGGVDLQLLGLGHNGHIGFNEPGEAFEKETHCVDLTESTIEANKRFFASADDVPKQAYTMGIKTIMQAKKILIVVNGENKADIVSIVMMPEYVKSGVIDELTLKKIYTTWVIRFLSKAKPIESHRVGDLIHFNFLLEKGAIRINSDRKLEVDFEKMPQAVSKLLDETIEIQLSRSPQKAKAWIDKYTKWEDLQIYIANTLQSLGVKNYIEIEAYF